jgi:hypothetical protein
VKRGCQVESGYCYTIREMDTPGGPIVGPFKVGQVARFGRIVPIVALLLAAAPNGCGSSLQAGGTGRDKGAGGAGGNVGGAGGAGTDGAVLGMSYLCTGGAVRTPDGGLVQFHADADASPAVECVVGQSYCSIETFERTVGAKPEYRCATFYDVVDGASVSIGLGSCADTPTCACLCSHGVICTTECACQDSGGIVTVSCDAI